MSGKIITRFAPSPTGFLHIGGARTALFNWVYAKKHNGKMLLRIEDTDRARSTDEATKAILDGLNWLGIDWEGKPISQFANIERHKEIAHKLVEMGYAYKCYCTPGEIEKMRQEARAKGQQFKYDGRCRAIKSEKTGVNPAIRIKSDFINEIIINDHVQGEVKFNSKNFDDFIILRSNGTPTYMLAVVVDDHDMGVTHIIRGDDHLTNAAKQIIIYKALNWQVPQMAHIPLIHGPDGAKLSKRHGALGVGEYRKMGYLPQALRNYLARLGWSHGDDEIFSTEQMIDWFELKDINKGAARFDFAKLANINAHYIKHSEPNELLGQMINLAKELKWDNDLVGLKNKTNIILALLPLLQSRAKTLVDLIEQSRFAYQELPLKFDEAAKELLSKDNIKIIKEITILLKNLENWDLDNIKHEIKNYAQENELKLGQVAQPLRAAIVASTNSPSIFDIIAILGKEEIVTRLEYVIKNTNYA